MQWGRAAGAAACLAAAVVTASACASTVTGTAVAQDGETASPRPSASPKSSGYPKPSATSSAARPSQAADRSGSATVPTCDAIDSAVTGVVRGYTLDRSTQTAATGDQATCFFLKGGEFSDDHVAVLIGELPLSAEAIARQRENLADTKPGEMIESAVATGLGGYISDPLGIGHLALVMPGLMVSASAGDAAGLSQEKLVEVLEAVGSAVAH
ncbi:hypothetical protein [Rhodococcus sp. Q]|uniref:hypothetical protein n=1 Tax=Rhodococcus sp. Q TaxID=2502252 RepID=UPI0010F9E9E0|nr:hypothetical protein [Rhodococcus sp. Q]